VEFVTDIAGAVDMDIYGAFQFCALGLLTTPFSNRIMRIYFKYQARCVLLAWASLIFTGKHVSVIVHITSLTFL
jgi:hypothetical protein